MIIYEAKRYGRRPFPVSFFLVLILTAISRMAMPAPGFAEPVAYVDRLIDTVREQKLYDDRYWWILLHYQKTLFGIESVVDDPDFFLAEKGKTDPQAEMEALVRTYFDPAHAADAPPVCQFIARYTWVKERLQPDPDKVPSLGCPAVEDIKPRSATLVFPTYYLNNPASMFGHTFINIETGYSNILLTNAVNYAADPAGANDLEYMIYGVFGGFKGYFSILPYYKKIREYSDIDQRDIWEYRLNLTPEELKRMVLHIRELEGIGSDYYFFGENCSYHLLFLLEVARPTLHLSDTFGLWVVPIDTVKKMSDQGLIDHAEFRPSNGTRIRQKLSLLSPSMQDVAYRICDGEIPPEEIEALDMNRDRKILMSELVGEYMKYRLVKDTVSHVEYKSVVMANLRMRSRLGSPETKARSMGIPPDPSDSHDTSRLCVGAGRRGSRWFQEIGINPSFTDLLNTDYTSNEGIQVQFLDTRIRYYSDDHEFNLEQVNILDIVSLFPRSRFFKPLSWKLNTGFRRQTLPDQSRGMTYGLNTGTGWSWQVPGLGLVSVMPELDIRASGDYQENVMAGVGLHVGMMKQLMPRWKMLFSARALHFEPDDRAEENIVSLEQNVKLSQNNRLRLLISREESFGVNFYEGSLAWQYYF